MDSDLQSFNMAQQDLYVNALKMHILLGTLNVSVVIMYSTV